MAKKNRLNVHNAVSTVALAGQLANNNWRSMVAMFELLHRSALRLLCWIAIIILLIVLTCGHSDMPHSAHIKMSCSVVEVAVYHQSERQDHHPSPDRMVLAPPTLDSPEQRPCGAFNEIQGIQDVCFQQVLSYQMWDHRTAAVLPFTFNAPKTYRTLIVVTKTYSLRCSPKAMLFYTNPSSGGFRDLDTGRLEPLNYFPAEQGVSTEPKELFEEIYREKRNSVNIFN